MVKKQCLADQIADVLSAAPVQFDPDDDNLDGTKATLADFGGVSEEDEADEPLLSKFRKQNVDLLADVDDRYAGKKGSRKKSGDDSSEEISISEPDEGDSEDLEEDQQSESLAEESDLSESENEGSISQFEEADSGFQHMSETRVPEQVKKGHCVRNQMNIWESLLEMRIQMQKCLVAANKMPQNAHFKQMEQSDSVPDFKTKVNETKESVGKVVDKLLQLQGLVIRKYPETKNLEKLSESKEQASIESDEEIPSDTEEEPESDHDESEDILPSRGKKRKLSDLEEHISNMHNKYRGYRNGTIEKWNTKTRLSVSKNAGQSHSVVSQIEHVLSNKDKLRRRTQLKRSDYQIIGQNDITNEDGETTDVKATEEYNEEIFDDSDFYHQLLRELIEVKSADITDPVQLGRQWIQLQNLRSKMKRKIDTRATKGRKIRYAVHSKLVNFMAPMDKQSWTEEAKNELYSSLFGKLNSKRT